MKTALPAPARLQLDAIPAPPIHVRRLMLATTVAVDGFVDQTPEAFHPALEHSFLMPQADIMVAGTRCSTPLLVREVRNIAAAFERDAIIVRATEEPSHATFDVILRCVARPFLGYRLWIRQPAGAAWLVPSAGERAFVRLDPLGLEVACEAPYTDEVDRYRGISAGGEFLSVAVRGWF
jgi:hypothetical protein